MFFNRFTDLYRNWKRDESLKEKLYSLYNNSRHEIREIWEKSHNLGQTNYELGVYYLKNGYLSDALFRFKILQLFGFKNPKIFYYIAYCYMDQIKHDAAIKYFNLYESSGDIEFTNEVHYFKSIIAKSDVQNIPLNLLEEKFDRSAGSFDRLHLKANQESYQLALGKMIHKIADQRQSFSMNILDIGCGTGILGDFLRQVRVAHAIVGVDLSNNMLEAAKKRMVDNRVVYDKLIHQDAFEFLETAKKNQNSHYDLIILSNFLTFNSDVKRLLELSHSILSPKAMIALSFRKTMQNDISFIHKIGEFSYREEFIISCAKQFNFELVTQEILIGQNQREIACIILEKS